MGKRLVNDLKQIIETFNQSLAEHLPALKNEINSLIQNKTRDSTEIEHCLDTLLSLTFHGDGDDLLFSFWNIIKLLIKKLHCSIGMNTMVRKTKYGYLFFFNDCLSRLNIYSRFSPSDILIS